MPSHSRPSDGDSEWGPYSDGQSSASLDDPFRFAIGRLGHIPHRRRPGEAGSTARTFRRDGITKCNSGVCANLRGIVHRPRYHSGAVSRSKSRRRAGPVSPVLPDGMHTNRRELTTFTCGMNCDIRSDDRHISRNVLHAVSFRQQVSTFVRVRLRRRTTATGCRKGSIVPRNQSSWVIMPVSKPSIENRFFSFQ